MAYSEHDLDRMRAYFDIGKKTLEINPLLEDRIEKLKKRRVSRQNYIQKINRKLKQTNSEGMKEYLSEQCFLVEDMIKTIDQEINSFERLLSSYKN